MASIKMNINGTITGKISDETVIRLAGAPVGAEGAQTPPPTGPLPPPIGEDPPFVIHNRNAPATASARRREDDEDEGGSRMWPWVLAVVLIILLLFLGALGLESWKLVTAVSKVPVDDDGRIPVVIHTESNVSAMTNDCIRPIITMNGDGEVDYKSDCLEIHAKSVDGTTQSTSTRGNSQPRRAAPVRPPCVCERDTTGK